MSKFKVGDRVKVICNENNQHFANIGDTGVVTEVFSDLITLLIDGTCKAVELFTERLELVTDTPVIQVGDRVKLQNDGAICWNDRITKLGDMGTVLHQRPRHASSPALMLNVQMDNGQTAHGFDSSFELVPEVTPASAPEDTLQELLAQQETLNQQIVQARKAQQLTYESGAKDPDWTPKVGEEFVRITSEGNVRLTKKHASDGLARVGNAYHPAHFEEVKRSVTLRHQLMEDTLRLGRPDAEARWGYMVSLGVTLGPFQVKVFSRPRWMQVDTYEKAKELVQKYSSADMQLIIKYL